MKIFLLCLVTLFGSKAFCQMPETRIYTLDISKERNKLQFKAPKLVGFKKGYNNQPYFTPDEKFILFVSNNGKGKTDIYKYDLKKKKSIRVTKTAEAEYSPKYNLSEDRITCVRVAKDTITQNFYSYNFSGKKGELLNNDLKTLGYYQWYSSYEIIGFLVPEPFVLCKYNINSNKCDTLLTHPGRTFQNYKGRIYFVDKSDSNNYYIRTLAKENLRSRKKDNTTMVTNPLVVKTLDGQEDFVIMNDGTILMSKENKLFAYANKRSKEKSEWVEIADFGKLGIESFYRLALSPDNTQLAVVAYIGKKP
jgi:WD40-like Beta Propeller Repeat